MPPRKHQELLTEAIEREGEAQRRLIDGDFAAARAQFNEVSELYRQSWEAAHARAFGRLVGMLKAAVLAGGGREQAVYARAALAGAAPDSPTANYARSIAALIVDDDDGAQASAARMSAAPDAFARTAEAISALAAHDQARYVAALEAIVRDFELRSEHLTGVAIADTALMLEALAGRRGMAATIESPVLPAAWRALRAAVPVARIDPVTPLADLPLIASGKVREIYEGQDRTLLIVASDRISTYDVVHPTPIPDKGAVLTGLSTFWFGRTTEIVPNHLLSVTEGIPEEARGRAMAVRRLEMLPIECVVRGYLSGSGWKDYQRTGEVCGIAVPAGLRESDRLPEPIFTPATKAQEGHDENIDFDRAAELVGDRALTERVRDVSIAIYLHASQRARERGIILADTKFEFGLDADGELTLGDEVCTPDSSRFWPADEYEPGRGQPSFDKQFVRDWASSTGWDRNPPAPPIPDDVVARTHEKYIEAYERITGEPFDAWLSRTR